MHAIFILNKNIFESNYPFTLSIMQSIPKLLKKSI